MQNEGVSGWPLMTMVTVLIFNILMATYSSTLAGKTHGKRSLAGFSPWGRKESDTPEQLTTAQHQEVSTSQTEKGIRTRSKALFGQAQGFCLPGFLVWLAPLEGVLSPRLPWWSNCYWELAKEEPFSDAKGLPCGLLQVAKNKTNKTKPNYLPESACGQFWNEL